MSDWLDRWAKRAARPGTSHSAPSLPGAHPDRAAPATSRRNFIKKAAVVGATAWSVPVVQSVTAPAAAASGPVVGQPCTGNGVCAGDGSYCYNGVCGAPGASCAGGAPCQYGNCAPNGICGGLGASCTSYNQATQCATVSGQQIYCSNTGSTSKCGGRGGNQGGAPCGTPMPSSPVCIGGAECKSYGVNINRCR